MADYGLGISNPVEPESESGLGIRTLGELEPESGLGIRTLGEPEPESGLEIWKPIEPESESGLDSVGLGLASTRARDSQVSGMNIENLVRVETKIAKKK